MPTPRATKINMGDPPDGDPNRLPKLSIVLSRADGQHTSISCWPTDDEIRRLSLAEFLDTYLAPMISHARDNYCRR